MTADYSRTCAGCECITEGAFATRANKNGTYYWCNAPAAGPWRGRVIGFNRRLEPFIPAWCPKLSEKGNGKNEQ